MQTAWNSIVFGAMQRAVSENNYAAAHVMHCCSANLFIFTLAPGLFLLEKILEGVIVVA